MTGLNSTSDVTQSTLVKVSSFLIRSLMLWMATLPRVLPWSSNLLLLMLGGTKNEQAFRLFLLFLSFFFSLSVCVCVYWAGIPIHHTRLWWCKIHSYTAPPAAAKVEMASKNEISEDAFGNDNPFGSNASSEVERERGEGWEIIARFQSHRARNHRPSAQKQDCRTPRTKYKYNLHIMK